MPNLGVGCLKKLPTMSRAQRALLRAAATRSCRQDLGLLRCSVQAAAWANFEANWLQICVDLPAVGDSLRVGAFACGV